MKLHHLLFASVATVSSLSLFASADIDRKIEDAAAASYNYRTVLQDQVKVKAHDGVVTLTGAVENKSNKDLAADTVENLPGVIRVENKITVTGKCPEHSDAWIAFKIPSLLAGQTQPAERFILSPTTFPCGTAVILKNGLQPMTTLAIPHSASARLTFSRSSLPQTAFPLRNSPRVSPFFLWASWSFPPGTLFCSGQEEESAARSDFRSRWLSFLGSPGRFHHPF